MLTRCWVWKSKLGIAVHPSLTNLCIVVAVTSRNSGSVRTRTVGSSIYNMTVQASNIISSQVRTGKHLLQTTSTYLLVPYRYTVQMTSHSIVEATKSSLASQYIMPPYSWELSSTTFGRTGKLFDVRLEFSSSRQLIACSSADAMRCGNVCPKMRDSSTSLPPKTRGISGMSDLYPHFLAPIQGHALK